MAPVAPQITVNAQDDAKTSKRFSDCKSTQSRATNDTSPDDSSQWSDLKPQEDGRNSDGGETETGTISTNPVSFIHDTVDEGFAPRCRNPDPLDSLEDDAVQNKTDGRATASVTLVVPRVVRVSPLHPKALRPDAIMAEEEAKRRKEAQVDFPRTSHPNMTPLTNMQHHNGSVRSAHQRLNPQQQQQQTMRASPSVSHSSSSKGKKTHSLGGGSINSSSVSSVHPTPLFQRLVSEEVQELKAYARIIENQNRRLSELERVHGDLEIRLEVQSNRRMELEKTLEDRERTWAERIEEMEQEMEHWKNLVNVERAKNAKLMDQVVRKDQDIHRMLQRKYDQKRGDAVNTSIRNTTRLPPSKTQGLTNGESPKPSANDLQKSHRSPHDILTENGSSEAVRERNVKEALLDFFGLG